MPILPPARVTSMTVFRTVAGASPAPFVPTGFEADGVNRRVHLGLSDDLCDLLLHIALRNVDRLAAEAAGLGQPFGVEVADDHDRGQAGTPRRPLLTRPVRHRRYIPSSQVRRQP